eukprot:TRINITY_DN23290_c0_g1_i1.p1 TRINITY_DN23290_c0_g1~~TRINITY_DN23290_c0_g1_i1.p1  ORF type:complete len:384 (+),score=83.89 TRINITY_DN23290_c0_g1_i1:31-1152(+)
MAGDSQDGTEVGISLSSDKQQVHVQQAGDVGHASFLAEFERRRREDRQRRQSQKKVSEVQQILQDVRQDRTFSGGDSAFPSPEKLVESAAKPSVLADAAELGTRLSSPTRRALSFSPSPNKTSEVQQILAEVQKERLAAASTGSAPAGKPVVVQSESSLRAKLPKAKAPAMTDRKSAISRSPSLPLQRKLSFEAPAATEKRASSRCTRTRARAASNTPKRRHEIGGVGSSFETTKTALWASNLRRTSSCKVESGSGIEKRKKSKDESDAGGFDFDNKAPPAAYPAGGWDDRTACPSSFDLFPGGVIKRQPTGIEAWLGALPRESEKPEKTRALPRESKEPEKISASPRESEKPEKTSALIRESEKPEQKPATW